MADLLHSKMDNAINMIRYTFNTDGDAERPIEVLPVVSSTKHVGQSGQAIDGEDDDTSNDQATWSIHIHLPHCKMKHSCCIWSP